VAWDSYIQRVGDYLANRESDPRVKYQDVYWSTLYDNHPRVRPLTTGVLSEASIDDALSIYADRFEGASDFTFFFVGSFNPESIRPLVEQWIGGLPSGRSGENWTDRGMRYSAKTGRTEVEAGMEKLSIVTQVWTGDWDGSWTERYHIQSLAAALDMKLLRNIREEASGTYSIGVYPLMEIAPVPAYRIAVQFTCDPERVDELTAKVKSEIDLFRRTLPDEKFAHDVAESQHRSLSENLKRNNWWLGQMVFAVESGTEPELMMNRRALYDSLNVQVLQQSANRYFDDSGYKEIILFPLTQN
jgi:zinc protease